MDTSVMAPVGAIEANIENEIPCLLVPITDKKLLLPTVSIAEMLSYERPDPCRPVDEPANWYLGDLKWRGIHVPMLSIEAMTGGDIAPVTVNSQIAILNNTGVNAGLPFISFLTQGIPRLSRVSPQEISGSGENAGDFFDMNVTVAGEQGIIPDVSKLEEACVQLFKL